MGKTSKLTIQVDLEKHMIFDKVLREYINECLESKVDPLEIVESLKLYVKTEAVKFYKIQEKI